MAACGVRRLRSGARPVRAAGEGCDGSVVGAVMREIRSLPKGRDPQGSGLRGPMRRYSDRVQVILTQERDPGRTPTKARKCTRAPRGDQPTPAPRHVRCGAFARYASRKRSWARRPGNACVPPANGTTRPTVADRCGRDTGVPRTPCPRKQLRGVKSDKKPLEPTPNRRATPSPWGENISTPDLDPLYQKLANSARGSASPCSISCDRLPGRRRRFRVRAGPFGCVRPRLPHVRRPDRSDIAPAPPLPVGCRQRSKWCSPSQSGSPSRCWPVRTEAGSCFGRSITPMHLRSERLAISSQ